jgi:hypothetical protein
MDTMSAFIKGEMHKNDEPRVFDWHKAARLIREAHEDARIIEEADPPIEVRAGLRDDWEYTGGPIYKGTEPVPNEDTYVYLASNWAIPEIEIDGHIEECWIYKKDSPFGEWDSGTYWPESALAILRGEE